MAGLITDLFNHLFTIARVSITDDGQGGTVREYQDLATVSGFMDPVSARSTERILGMQQQTRILYTLFILPTDIGRGDRVTVADGPPEKTVYVLDVRNPGLLNHHYECLVEEAQAGEAGKI